jgi:hypothetical protein
LIKKKTVSYSKQPSINDYARAMDGKIKIFDTIYDEEIYVLWAATYKIYTYSLLPEIETEITYDQQGSNPVTVETTNTYTNKLLTKREVTDSDGKIIREEFKYPFSSDYQNSEPYKTMVTENILPVVEKITYNNNSEISRLKTNYAKTGNLFLPSEVQTSYTGISGLKTELTYNQYNSKGNLLQYTTKDGISTTLLWGYNYQYPVAEIKNATYNQVKTALTETLLNRVADAYNPAVGDINAINNLRTNTSFSKAFVTTCTYKPLVGMLSASDPRNIAVSYEYDSYARLQTGLFNGKKEQKYDYNYIQDNSLFVNTDTTVTRRELYDYIINNNIPNYIVCEVGEHYFTIDSTQIFRYKVRGNSDCNTTNDCDDCYGQIIIYLGGEGTYTQSKDSEDSEYPDECGGYCNCDCCKSWGKVPVILPQFDQPVFADYEGCDSNIHRWLMSLEQVPSNENNRWELSVGRTLGIDPEELNAHIKLNTGSHLCKIHIKIINDPKMYVEISNNGRLEFKYADL